MVDQQYQVVFRGEIAPDTRIEEVKANLAKLFKTDDARIERLFSGKAMVLKKGICREDGERYRALLEKAGALCEVVPLSLTSPPSVPSAENDLPAKRDDSGEAGAHQAIQQEDSGATAASNLKQRAAAIKEKVQAVQAGELQETLGTIREKVQGIDAGEAGRKVSSLLEGATASVHSDLRKGGLAALKQKKIVWAAAGVAFCIIVALVMMLGGSTKPMPIEKNIFDEFAKQYSRDVRKADFTSAGTTVLIGLARETIEDMGFNFDRTLLFWLLRKDFVESEGGLPVYTNILVDPVAVAVAADLSGIGDLIAPETRQIFKISTEVPSGVDLSAIKMVKACPATGSLLNHDDLLQVLKENAVPFDASQPDLAIADVFIGLDEAGLIKIHRRWENDDQFSDIEIMDLAALNAVEEKLEYLNKMKVKFASE
jgi:hypothetical protein